jgi:hypothetical protein
LNTVRGVGDALPFASVEPRAEPWVFVYTSDALVSAGARTVLHDRGVRVFTVEDVPATVLESEHSRREHRIGVDAFVFEAMTEHPDDRYHMLGLIGDLRGEPNQCMWVALTRRPLHPVVTLRAAEAGVDFVMPYEVVARSPESLRDALLEPDEQFRVATPREIRERLGYARDGDLSSFLDETAKWDVEVWRDEERGRRSGLPRRAVLRLRRAALEVAGMPEPDVRRYSTSLRSAPELPVWAEVHGLVRLLLGFDELRG